MRFASDHENDTASQLSDFHLQLVTFGNGETFLREWRLFVLRAARKNSLHRTQNVLNRDPGQTCLPLLPDPFIHRVYVDVLYRNIVPIWFEMIPKMPICDINGGVPKHSWRRKHLGNAALHEQKHERKESDTHLNSLSNSS